MLFNHRSFKKKMNKSQERIQLLVKNSKTRNDIFKKYGNVLINRGYINHIACLGYEYYDYFFLRLFLRYDVKLFGFLI